MNKTVQYKPIKFRIWDKETKYMNDYFIMDPYGQVYSISDYEWFNKKQIGFFNSEKLNMDNIILMQSTGILDKNGLDIYEGDIVKYPDSKMVFKIIFDSKQCQYLMINKNLKITFDYQRGNCSEIIGNIYEHPDLLPQTKE